MVWLISPSSSERGWTLPAARSRCCGGRLTSSPRHSRARSAAVSGGGKGSSDSPSAPALAVAGPAGWPALVAGRGRRRFLGGGTAASPGTRTTGGLSAGGAWVRGAHGGRSTRYIAPAPSATPMTSPIEPRTASLYHASRAPAVEPRVAAGIVLAAIGSYLAAAAIVPARLWFVAAQLALAVVAGAAVAIVHRPRPLAAL